MNCCGIPVDIFLGIVFQSLQRAVKDGEKYFRHAVQLKKVANINTMESQNHPRKKMLHNPC